MAGWFAIERTTRAVRVEQLDDGVGLGERWRAVATAGRRPVVAEPRGDARIVRALQQEAVGLGAQLLSGADVRGVHASDDHDRERRRDDEQQPEAQAHAARTVYPMPRIVWMRRGAPSISVLRRRYPM